MTEIQRLTQTILVLILSLDINRVWGASEVDKHLEMGKKFLQEGNLADALNHYNMAVDGDPSNYLTYFKRAAVFLALGQSKRALPDLDKVLELKPDFHQARSERASTNLKLGKLQLASDDYHKISSTGTSLSEEAKSILTKIEEVRLYMDEVDSFLEMGAFDEAIARLQISVELCPWDAKLRQKRADCFEKVGQYQSAISDIKMLTKLIPDNTQGFLRVSKLYYQMGEIEDSLKEIRECLKLDPDHKECYPLYKKVKKLNKQLSNAQKDMDEERYDEGLQTLDSALRTETEVLEIVKQIKRMICECHTKLKNVEIGIEKCDEAFEADPQNVNLLCDKAELYIVNEQYEEAIKIYQEASNIDNHYQRIKDGLHRAQNLLKQSQKRDYYKILGVKRTASTKEINKAYRELAKKWHPDKYEGEDKENAEKKFYDIAAAKEVLSNKEMREKFDNGEDPLDHEQQQGHGHGGFPFGFNPFGGGGQGFTFKFNFG